MTADKSTARLTLLWILSAVVCSTLLWWLLAGVLAPILEGRPPALDVSIYWAGMFGFLTSFLLAFAYLPLVWVWVANAGRLGYLESTTVGLAIGCLLLSLPGTLAVLFFYGGSGAAEALATAPYVVLSGWGGLLIPRMISGPLALEDSTSTGGIA